MDTKHCSKCDSEKPLEEFHRNKGAHDGRTNWCKPCACAHVRTARRANLEHYRTYDRERAQRPERKAADVVATRRKRAKNRLRYKAHWTVANEIRNGRLRRGGCEVCGESPTDAHHDDYKKPLEVRWLCRTHHCEHHTGALAKARED